LILCLQNLRFNYLRY